MRMPGVDGKLDSLPTLRAGEAATIAKIEATEVAAKRLADMGFVRGARIVMLRPGWPCLVRIGPTCVGLGAAHQRNVLLSRPAESEPGVECPASRQPASGGVRVASTRDATCKRADAPPRRRRRRFCKGS